MSKIIRYANWCLLTVCVFSPLCSGQEVEGVIDRVKVRLDKNRPSDPDNIVERTGTILTYNRDGIVMERTSGRDTTIKPEQIISVIYAKTTEHHNAIRLHREGQLLGAFQWYQQALEKEKRTWVRQQLMASATECLANSGRRADAAIMFGNMFKEDANTRFFHVIPLVWSEQPVGGNDIKQIQSWITSNQPVAQLIAASWILGTPSRQQASEVLTKLSQNTDSQIAHMASAQLWRTQFLNADGQFIDRWQMQINRMPVELRAGPEFILGRALARNKKYNDAAAKLMKVAIIDKCDDRLAAASLYRAGQALMLGDSKEESQLIFEELIREYPNSQPAQFARQAMQTR